MVDSERGIGDIPTVQAKDILNLTVCLNLEVVTVVSYSMENIVIQVWKSEEKKQRWEELMDCWDEYCLYEPLFSACIGITDEENKEKFKVVFQDVINYDNTPAIVAFDLTNKKAVGFIASFTEYRAGTNPKQVDEKVFSDFGNYGLNPDVAQKLNFYGDFLTELMVQADIYNKYGVDKVILVEHTSVLRSHCRRGIANAMTAKLIQVAKDLEFQLIVAESTSNYTKHSKIKTFQFEKICEMEFAGHYANYLYMPESIKETHKSMAVLVKRI